MQMCPLTLQGVLAPDDARAAIRAGSDGIVVSNHGGRQLDGTPSALDVLPHVAAAVAGRVPILMDGGVRRGTDVLKVEGAGLVGGAPRGGGLGPLRGPTQPCAWERVRCRRRPCTEALPCAKILCFITHTHKDRRTNTPPPSLLPSSIPTPQCLALGASAVLIGRPVLWGLTLGGEEGVRAVLSTMRAELELSMALLGVASVQGLNRDYLVPPMGGGLVLPAARM